MESRENDEPEPFRIREHLSNEEHALQQNIRQRARKTSPARPVFRIGGTIIPSQSSGVDRSTKDSADQITSNPDNIELRNMSSKSNSNDVAVSNKKE